MTEVFVLDGTRIGSLEDFWREIGNAVNGPGGYFGSNLDALADCLRGGPGAPDTDDYLIEWRHHDVSRRALGHPETVRQLEIRLRHCHPTNRPAVQATLDTARAGRGETVFDWITDVFDHVAPAHLRLS